MRGPKRPNPAQVIHRWSDRLRAAVWPLAGSQPHLVGGIALTRLAERQGYFLESARRYADHYRAVAQLCSSDFEALHDAGDNIFSALAVYCDMGAWAEAGQILQAVDVFLDSRGHWDEQRSWLERVLSHRDALGRLSLTCDLLDRLAMLANSQGDRHTAALLYRDVIRLAELADDTGRLSLAYFGLGTVQFGQGHEAMAHANWKKALTMAEGVGDPLQLSMIRYFLDHTRGTPPKSEDVGQKSLLERIQTVANTPLETVSRTVKTSFDAMSSYLRGQWPQARQYFLEMLEITRAESEQQGMAIALYHLGQIAQRQNDFATALDYYQQCEAITRSLNDKTGLTLVLWAVGFVHLQQQRFDLALPYLEESTELERASGAPAKIAESLYWLGYAVSNAGSPERGRQIWEESLGIFTRLGSLEAQKVREVLLQLQEVMDRQEHAPTAERASPSGLGCRANASRLLR